MLNVIIWSLMQKTVYTVVGRCNYAVSELILGFLDRQAMPWCDHFKYLGVNFVSGVDLDVNIAPVKRNFYVACNSIIARSHGVADPVRVQLVKSFCLPLIVYCIGALKLKGSAIQQLSVCWNDAFRHIFHFKRFESVRCLQVNFGTLDFQHLYDLHRWRFF